MLADDNWPAPEAFGVPLEDVEAKVSMPGGAGDVALEPYGFWKGLCPIEDPEGILRVGRFCPLMGRGDTPIIPLSYRPCGLGDAAEETDSESYDVVEGIGDREYEPAIFTG